MRTSITRRGLVAVAGIALAGCSGREESAHPGADPETGGDADADGDADPYDYAYLYLQGRRVDDRPDHTPVFTADHDAIEGVELFEDLLDRIESTPIEEWDRASDGTPIVRSDTAEGGTDEAMDVERVFETLQLYIKAERKGNNSNPYLRHDGRLVRLRVVRESGDEE